MQDLQHKETILRESPLVAGQHTANKCHALVCSHCFQFLGSIGLQVAWCRLAAAADGMYSIMLGNNPAWPNEA